MVNLTRYKGNRVDTLMQIDKAGQRDSTAREGIQDRILKGINSDYFQKGCWHSEGIARINGINYWCLGDYAPTMKYFQETLVASKASQYLALTSELSIGEKSIAEVIKQTAEIDADKPLEQRRVLIPNKQEIFAVDSKDFGDVDIARFLARDAKLAQEYGNFLDNACGIRRVIFYQPLVEKDIAAGLWLCNLCKGEDFDIRGNYIDFCVNSGSSFGVSN